MIFESSCKNAIDPKIYEIMKLLINLSEKLSFNELQLELIIKMNFMFKYCNSPYKKDQKGLAQQFKYLKEFYERCDSTI